MKSNLTRLLSLIILTISILSLSGCEFLTGSSNTPPSSDDPSVIDPFCYSIRTERTEYNYGDEEMAEYNYGDEIEIIFTVQFTEKTSGIGRFTVCIEESSYFEIIGEKSYIFENVDKANYSCHNKTDAFEVIFNVKFHDLGKHSYDTSLFNITAEFGDNQNVYMGGIFNMYFITDSQGVLIHQVPYSYEHTKDEMHGYDYFKTRRSHETDIRDLLVASLNREYLAGFSAEDLIDRYIHDSYQMKDKVYLYRQYKASQLSFVYISSGIRIKIYLPADHEFYINSKNHLETREGDVKIITSFLIMALENGAITEEEYKAEIERISNEEQILDVVTWASARSFDAIIPLDMKDDLLFPIPTDDECFNKVITVTNS